MYRGNNSKWTSLFIDAFYVDTGQSPCTLVSHLLVVDRHRLKSFDMDSVQVGKAVFGKEILSSSRLFLHFCHIYILDFGRKTHCQTSCSIRLLLRLAARAEGGRGLGGKQSGEALASFADSHRTAPAFLGRISE